MGRLPNDVRTALMKSEAKETGLLASLLLGGEIKQLSSSVSL